MLQQRHSVPPAKPETPRVRSDTFGDSPGIVELPTDYEMQEVYATIAALPEDRRLALVAVDVLGLSYREAARALRVREATITTRLFRARKQVAKQLAPAPDSLAPASSEPDSPDLTGASTRRRPPSPTVRGNETLPTGVLSSRGTP
jgi:predicted DNA-binding protein (UPF0251 family)